MRTLLSSATTGWRAKSSPVVIAGFARPIRGGARARTRPGRRRATCRCPGLAVAHSPVGGGAAAPIESGVTSTVNRSPASMPSACRALLGTTIWCLALTLTLSIVSHAKCDGPCRKSALNMPGAPCDRRPRDSMSVGRRGLPGWLRWTRAAALGHLYGHEDTRRLAHSSTRCDPDVCADAPVGIGGRPCAERRGPARRPAGPGQARRTFPNSPICDPRACRHDAHDGGNRRPSLGDMRVVLIP